MWSMQVENKHHKFQAGKTDPAFYKLKSNSIGFFVFNVENNHATLLPKEQYGQFRDNSTYIIYAAMTKGVNMNSESNPPHEIRNTIPIYRFIHFWLGTNTSTDKSADVAYKVIELDNHLDNTATLYRETQENESTRFKAYFKNGITILSGDADETTQVTLFQVKNKIYSQRIQKFPINWLHFVSNYIMLLLSSSYYFIWIGTASTRTEKLNALRFVINLRNQQSHNGTDPNIIIVDDGYEQSMPENCKLIWNQYLNLNNRFVHPVISTILTSTFSSLSIMKLYKCQFTNNKYRIEEIKTGMLNRIDLSGNEAAFIIDCYPKGIWIWLGKSTSTIDKAEAMRNARGFVKKKNYPSTTPVYRVLEGSEPIEFINIFPNWNEPKQKVEHILGKFDTSILLQRPKLAAMYQLMDDGSGETIIYKIKNGCLMKVPTKQDNILALFSNNCFLIHYIIKFNVSNLMPSEHPPIIKHVLYVWFGGKCSIELKKLAEKLGQETFKNLQHNVIQIRVHEGLEPQHFLQVFNGKLIIFSGMINSECHMYAGTTSKVIIDNEISDTYVLKVIGDSTYNSKAIQIDGKSEITSNDCYILKGLRNRDIWIWCGQYTSGDKQCQAREIAKVISTTNEYNLARESSEPDEFWNCLTNDLMMINFRKVNNRNSISKTDSKLIVDSLRVGLYICCIDPISQNHFDYEQIKDFEQKDLKPDDIFILDVGFLVYVWVGSLCSSIEREKCWNIAINFLNSFPVPRNLHTSIALVQQGCEPITFTGLFNDWNSNLFDNYKPFDVLCTEILHESKQNLSNVQRNLRLDGENEFNKYVKYPIDLLRNTSLPPDIDHQRKEIHLTHDDFISVFQMNYTDFQLLPDWKKLQLRKLHKFF